MGGAILWMDSANLFKQHPENVFKEMSTHGVYALKGQASLAERCDPRVLSALDVPQELYGLPERVACVFGVATQVPGARRLVDDWLRHAMNPDHIRPPDPMYRHMDDQALLSCLLLKAQSTGDLKLQDAEVDISSPHPVRWLSTRNKVHPSLPVWADSVARAYYAAAKVANQVSLKLERRFATRHLP